MIRPLNSAEAHPLPPARSRASPEMIEAAEGMEALFLDYMMKTMRNTVPNNEMDLESPATRIYRGMLDSEYAKQSAHLGGIGLADQLIDYLVSLNPEGYNLPQGQKAPMKEKP